MSGYKVTFVMQLSGFCLVLKTYCYLYSLKSRRLSFEFHGGSRQIAGAKGEQYNA